jgi:hypothetical protein
MSLNLSCAKGVTNVRTDGCTDYLSGSMDAWMGDVDRRMQERIRGQSVNECKNGSINGCMDGCTYRWLDTQMNGSIDGGLDEQTNGSIRGWMYRT